MKKIITMLLTISLIVGTLSIPAYAAEYGGSWADYLDYWKTWLNQVQIAADAPEETDPAETEEPAMEEPAVPEESEEPEVPVESEAPVEYRIRYDANGGIWWNMNASPATKNVSYVYVQVGKSTKALNAPTRGGYAFRGWQAEDGTVYAAQEAFVPDCDMNLKAIWEWTLD